MTPRGVAALFAFKSDQDCCDCFDLAQLRPALSFDCARTIRNDADS
jgi:hypothetical protein